MCTKCRKTGINIASCRLKKNRNVADDDVFKTVDMYFRGLWDKDRVLDELRYYKMNDQICIVNQHTLDQILAFQTSYEVK